MSFPAIPFAKPDIGSQEEEAVLRVLRSGWLTTGAEAIAFEREFADFSKCAWALAVNSATSGLHLALEALGIGPGDRIAVSPYTFTASAEIMRYLGADPVFIDITPGTYHMDACALAKALESAKLGKTLAIKAIMPVHIGGVAWNLDEIYRIATEYAVPIVEDAAHAFPARLKPNAPERANALELQNAGQDHVLGSGGDIGVFSFYANKTITTAEGGMVIGSDPHIAARIKIMRSHGIDREVWQRFSGQAQQWQYAVVEPGFKYNLPDLCAAIGRVQLQRADHLMQARRRIAQQYNNALRTIPWLSLPPHHDWADTHAMGHSWHLYAIQLHAGPKNAHGQVKDAMDIRNRFIKNLQEAGIGSSVHYTSLHLMPYYSQKYNLSPQDFPHALQASQRTLSLPLWPGLDDESVQRVISILIELVVKEYGTAI